MVKTLPSNAGGAVGSLVKGAKIQHASWSINQNRNRNNTVTNSIKILKMAHIKKLSYKNKTTTKNLYSTAYAKGIITKTTTIP